MRGEAFRFRQFRVRHDRCGMKVGTDGILLGAWTDGSGANRILDIGTGSGLIALMLAQRYPPARITAIEPDETAAKQATGNVHDSPWSGRIDVQPVSLQQFVTDIAGAGQYDLLVCNPPFFAGGTPSPETARHQARNSSQLDADELLPASRDLLAEHGRLSLVIPAGQESAMCRTGRWLGLKPRRVTHVRPFANRRANRVLLELQANAGESAGVESSLVIYDQPGVYSSAYRKLTGDYYLDPDALTSPPAPQVNRAGSRAPEAAEAVCQRGAI